MEHSFPKSPRKWNNAPASILKTIIYIYDLVRAAPAEREFIVKLLFCFFPLHILGAGVPNDPLEITRV